MQSEHVSQGSTILFCLIPCHYFSVQNDHWLSECSVSHSTLWCKQEQCVFFSTSQLCHFPSIFGEIHPTPVRWLIYLKNFSNFPKKCSEILLKITWKLKPFFWSLQTGQCSCQDCCFHSGSKGNFLETTSPDNQVVREGIPFDGKEFIFRKVKKRSRILLIVVTD